MFESRFRDGAGAEFPLRQYLRCREDFVSGIVHLVLLAVFLVVLLVFGRTLQQMFTAHAPDVNPWIRRGAFVTLGVFCLSVVRRLVYKVAELRATRREMNGLQASFRGDGGDLSA